jgi:hypothetical protein
LAGGVPSSSNTSTLGGWGNFGTAFGSFTQRTGMLSTILNVGSNTSASTMQSDQQNQAEEVITTANKELSKSSETLVGGNEGNVAHDTNILDSSTTPQQPHQQQVEQESEPNSTMASSMGSQQNSIFNRSPDDFTKEELFEIISKMNKRLKALNTIRLQLQEKYTKVDNDYSRILSLLKEEILSEVDIIDASNQLEVGNKGTERR